MHARTTARSAVAGNKLNLGMVCVNNRVAANVQAQPFGGVVWRYVGGARAGVPRSFKVVTAIKYKSAVARAHQALRIRCRGVVKIIEVASTASA